MEHTVIQNGYQKRETCASCGGNSFETILDLGVVPLAGYFPTKEELKNESKYPLSLLVCNDCKLVQTDSVINPKLLFEDYRYLSSIGLSKHFSEVADILNERYGVKDKHILEIGCNDGVLLEPLQKLGAIVEGVDPAVNVVKLATNKGLKVYNDFFNDKTFGGNEFKGKYDLVISNNTFAHIIDLQSVVRGIHHVLKPNGDFILEVHYLKNLVQGKQWDNIYHEHYNYWSLTSLVHFFNQLDAKIFRSEKIDTHGGSIRVYIKKDKKVKVEQSVKRMLKEEEDFGIKDFKTYQNFGEKVYKIRDNVLKNIKKLKDEYKSIIGYGAPAKATTALNFFGITEEIDFIVEDNKLKHNKFIPGVKIPIKNKSSIKDKKNILLVLAWNFYNDIKKNNKDLSENFVNIKELESSN